MKTIIVTGSAGFIGTNLTERLLSSEENRIIGIDNLFSGQRKNAEIFKQSKYKERYLFLQEDIANKKNINLLDFLMEKHSIDKISEIYHLACPASPPKYQADPLFTLDTCFRGTENILKFASEPGSRVLFSSTSEVYGDPLEHPQTERYKGNVNSVGPRSCYDEGKRVAESLCYEFNKKDVDVRVVRIFNTYGPYMDPLDGRVVSNVINQALRREDITLYGDGKQTRSFCYVDDLVNGFLKFMNLTEKYFGPINLGNPVEFSMNELAEKVIQLIPGCNSKIVYKDLPKDDPARRKPDISRALEVLDWEPKISLEDGLVKTIEYFRGLQKK